MGILLIHNCHGLRQELEMAKFTFESLEEHLQSGEKHINGEREEQRRKLPELELDNKQSAARKNTKARGRYRASKDTREE